MGSEDASSEKEGSINLLKDEEACSEKSSLNKEISLSEETPKLNSIGECHKQGTVWCKPFELLRKVTLEELEVEVIADIPCVGKNVISGSEDLEEDFANKVVKLDHVENQNSKNGEGQVN